MSARLVAALLLHLVAQRGVSTGPRPEAVILAYGSVALLAGTRADARAVGIRRNVHLVAAVSGLGDVSGAVLRPTGSVFCEFAGVFDFGTGCVVLAGCGGSGLFC
jgi:hypothetical protein